MTRFAVTCRFVLVGAPLLIVSCAKPLPRYSWRDPSEALKILAYRASVIDTVSATGQVTLESSEGAVELTGVLVAQPPHRLRLRAWKLSQPVFDFVLNEDGLFVFHRGGEGPLPDFSSSITQSQLAEALANLPPLEAKADWEGVRVTKKGLIVTKALKGAGRLECDMEKQTLTATLCRVVDDAGEVRQTLAYTRYRRVGEAAWPMCIAGWANGASFEFRFDQVHINTELPPTAFIPSRRAERIK